MWKSYLCRNNSFDGVGSKPPISSIYCGLAIYIYRPLTIDQHLSKFSLFSAFARYTSECLYICKSKRTDSDWNSSDKSSPRLVAGPRWRFVRLGVESGLETATTAKEHRRQQGGDHDKCCVSPAKIMLSWGVLRYHLCSRPSFVSLRDLHHLGIAHQD